MKLLCIRKTDFSAYCVGLSHFLCTKNGAYEIITSIVVTQSVTSSTVTKLIILLEEIISQSVARNIRQCQIRNIIHKFTRTQSTKFRQVFFSIQKFREIQEYFVFYGRLLCFPLLCYLEKCRKKPSEPKNEEKKIVVYCVLCMLYINIMVLCDFISNS